MKVFQKKGFTLVELMVVVVILGVLGAVGMVSYSSYLGGSRDSNRLTQLSDIRSGLNVYAINKNLPTPEDKVDVLANANIVAYQGYAGEKTLRLIGYSDGGTDPLDESFFTYYLTKNKKDFQLMGFLEEESVLQSGIMPQTYADDIDYSERIPTVTGKKLGALVENGTNTPIQEILSLSAGLDIATTGTTYNAYYTDQDVISGTGSQLIKSVSNQNCNRILELGNSIGSGIYKISPTGNGVVQVYCDMETDGGGWTLVGVFGNPTISLTSSAVGNPGSFLNDTGWKFSDNIINSLSTEYFRFEPIAPQKCNEKLFCKTFPFDYATQGSASNKTTCSRELDGTYVTNGSYGNLFTISHWNARDVWINYSAVTRWETEPGNPCGFTDWWHQPGNGASPSIRMFTK